MKLTEAQRTLFLVSPGDIVWRVLGTTAHLWTFRRWRIGALSTPTTIHIETKSGRSPKPAAEPWRRADDGDDEMVEKAARGLLPQAYLR